LSGKIKNIGLKNKISLIRIAEKVVERLGKSGENNY
jgi:hypothetical protein